MTEISEIVFNPSCVATITVRIKKPKSTLNLDGKSVNISSIFHIKHRDVQ